MLENKCNESDTQWEVKLMLFNSMVTQVLLYGVQVWEGTISLNAWNEFDNIQNMFLRRQLGVKYTTSYQVMILKTSVRPIEILGYNEYIDTLQKSRICQITDYHILLGMLDINYKRITKAKFSH